MADYPYNTQRWQRLRKMQLAEYPLCVVCLSEGRTTPATDVDHIVAIRNGGDAWAMENLQSLCHGHHSSKTAADKRGEIWQRPGYGANGWPLAEEHVWNKKGRGG